MKKILSILCAVTMLFLFCACSEMEQNRTKQNNTKTVEDVLNGQNNFDKSVSSKKNIAYIDGDISGKKADIDLTKMNSTMVYSEVNNMMINPESYDGKTIKMRGSFNVFEGEEQNYFACLIADATACCSQGIEFVLKKEREYPEEYPSIGQEILVIGKFETYFEGESKYCHLKDALIN